MRNVLLLCWGLMAGLAVAAPSALAADTPMQLMGRWVERGISGSIRWDLGPDSIAVTPIDAQGRPMAEPQRLDVLYQRSGDGWAVVVRAPDGRAMGEGRAEVRDGRMMLLLPGIGSHELQRQ
ncbi:hypothetical protein SAMN04488068_0501 [Hydrocarboniphaga daqingensis]|uniref:DUF2147 domain-containing protein n=1 Tax=Hydrocarboniphaga daqingensis TaxID=490188 RepID=A0A1M5KFD0_9GAMM|nr:hypothetical protein [Hydrocarboniphaga daqingensis]SHG50893.1 hypothetical protein SAMN04488068_0501 [Hydrocarboniphaga daqingensis]